MDIFDLNILAGSWGTSKLHVFLTDGGGSTRVLSSLSGGTIENYGYDAYGNLIGGGDGSGLGHGWQTDSYLNSTLYRNQWYDNNGRHYLRSRFYDSFSGRFYSRDSYRPEVFNSWDRNGYGYVHGDPVNSWDPTGMWTLKEVVGVSFIVSLLAAFTYSIYNNHFATPGINRNTRPVSVAVVLGQFNSTLERRPLGGHEVDQFVKHLRNSRHGSLMGVYNDPNEDTMRNVLARHEIVFVFAHGMYDVTKDVTGWHLDGVERDPRDGTFTDAKFTRFVTANELAGAGNGKVIIVSPACDVGSGPAMANSVGVRAFVRQFHRAQE